MAGQPPTRVLGRQVDLWRRGQRAGEQRLCDALARWSLDGNHGWLAEGVRHDVPFLQISAAAAGTVLAWELERLRADGYVPVGPCWVPRRWFFDAEGYRRVVRLVQQHLAALPAQGAAGFVPKVAGELEPLLAMWPHVLVLPTSQRLTIADLTLLRAFPLHPLGVVARPTPADGQPCSPAEYFAHDVDHARYKIREDLLVRGVPVPDPYQDGTTWDPATGAHRQILGLAVPFVDGSAWQLAGARAAFLGGLWRSTHCLADRALGAAARWLLFEMLHEKSLPLDRRRLQAELASGAHGTKLRRKVSRRFFGAFGPRPLAVARLAAAQEFLGERLGSVP